MTTELPALRITRDIHDVPPPDAGSSPVQYVYGLAHYFVNGEEVPKEEFDSWVAVLMEFCRQYRETE